MTMVLFSPSRACRILFVLFLTCGLLAGCSDSNPSSASVPPPVGSIAASSPTTQSAPVGTEVPSRPSVIVEDTNQAPMAGVHVTFAVTGGGGTVTGASQVTDASGKATIGEWVLGPNTGANTLTASVAGSGITGNPVTFTATGTGGGPAPDTAVVRFATYWGGSEEDQVRDLATDAHGNIYAVGGTASNDFPTTLGAFDRTHDDSPNGTVKHYDVFVSKFDSTGTLIWSTLLGGPGYDRAYAVEVDAQGFVYIGGRAGVGFPVTAGAAQTVFRGGAVALYGEEDGFVCKLQPDGSALVFCTYFGTNDFNIVRDIDIDPQGNVYIASSAELDFPASDTYFNGSYQPTRKAGLDCVIAKLNASGSSFAWATWIGGSGDDGTQPSVRVDGQGNVWYAGGAQSTDLPMVNPSQPSFGGDVDIYLAKLSPDGKDLLFSTYLGGSGAEGSETHNLAVNRATGDIYVGSATSSTNLPVTANALQPGAGGGGRDGLLARYSNSGTLLSLTYMGGSSTDRFEGILVGSDGNVYVSGIGQQTYSTVGPSGSLGNEDASGLILSPDLGQVVFGIRIGGNDNDNGRAVAPMPGGGFVMAGISSSSDFPSRDAEQTNFGGGTSDGWIGRFIPR
jgi:Beta-propeller repeat